jgi:EAL domain-containing protein (putative c-di-GMP-specific phosphodiesterase class I)
VATKILESIRNQIVLIEQAVYVTASVGISFYPQDGQSAETVLERAGTPMYRIKHKGGNSFGFYSPESSIVWTRDRLEFEKELRVALSEGRLQVLFQPITDLNQHQIVKMEALVRWPHPTRGFLSPGEFIPLAEHTGLIRQLGETVLRTACIAAYNLLQDGKKISVSVNINPRQLFDGNLSQTISQTLKETGLPADLLVLEITEDAVVSDLARAAEILSDIKALGVSIALDDFGTGYSSLSLLRELPIDILKIDKSFIRLLDQNINDLTITQAIIGLGRNLNLDVIAEGVESKQQMQVLLNHECYLQQGYYFSRPIPIDSFLTLVDEPSLTNSTVTN